MNKFTWLSLTAVGLLTVTGCGQVNNNTAVGTTTNQTATNQTTATTGGGQIQIAETGSSLLYPLFNDQWVPAYQAGHANVRISAASTGSGAGIQGALDGTAQIGGSDAYLADAQMAANPGMLNIPLAVSAQQVMYNLPGMKTSKHLNMTGEVLAKIYEGKITSWDDSAIKKINPGVKLPHHSIIPITRSDGSGDTFLFTQYLTKTSADWANTVRYGTTVSWPALPSEIAQKGNSGMVDGLTKNPYSIAYVGISWKDKAVQQGIGYAALQNQSKKYVLPTNLTIKSAASAMVNKVPQDERVSLIYAPGTNSYPIVNFEYAIVNPKQSSQVGTELKKFLTWGISPTGGNTAKYLTPVNFLPLPASIQKLSQAQIAKISG